MKYNMKKTKNRKQNCLKFPTEFWLSLIFFYYVFFRIIEVVLKVLFIFNLFIDTYQSIISFIITQTINPDN